MLASEIIALAQDWTYTTDTQYPTATKGLRDLNIIYRELIAEINQDVNNDLFTDTYFTDLVAGQFEYAKPTVAGSIAGMNNMLNVSVNYSIPVLQTGTVSLTGKVLTGSWTTFTQNFMVGQFVISGTTFMFVVSITSNTSMNVNIINNWPTSFTGQTFYSQLNAFTKCRSERSSNLAQDKLWYMYNQPQQDPFYIMFDTGVQVFPASPVDVSFGYKIEVTKDVVPLTASDTPIVDDNWHYVMALGLRHYIFMAKGQMQEAIDARTHYREQVEVMKNTISDTQLEPLYRFTPELPEFQ